MAAKLIPKIEDVVENVVEDLGVPGIAAIVLLPERREPRKTRAPGKKQLLID